jgi:hypothetical protein
MWYWILFGFGGWVVWVTIVWVTLAFLKGGHPNRKR